MKKLCVTIGFFISLTACGTDDGLSRTADSNTMMGQSMVVTANPHATKAGIAVLKEGGSAVDAAIAIEAVLSLVEPQSSGLAGGGFMVYFDNSNKEVSVYDGRETAPSGAQPDMFLTADGKRMGFLNAKNSGLSTGVPGMISMLAMAHQDHGILPWGEHFDAAKKLATQGFEVSPRLHGMIKRFGKYIPQNSDQGPTDAYNYFHVDDQPLAVGHLLKNPDYAEALALIANDPASFYQGEIAQKFVNMVAQKPRAGSLSKEDLASYQAKKRTALCMPYKDMQLCGPPPPSSWVAVGMTVAMLEQAPKFSDEGAQDPANWSIFAQSQQLAYSDRDHFVADSDAVLVPIKGLSHPQYLASRASKIVARSAMADISHGDPWTYQNELPNKVGVDATDDKAGTTHFVVVDKNGNVVSLTASVESIFGSTRMVGGMFLNNQLTDFSFQPKDTQGNPIANAIAPGKRPRSSMSPTIVLDKHGEFKMATGSPGGNSIIAYTAKTLVGVLDWGLSPQQAVNLPNMVARGDKVRIESERAPKELIDSMRGYGFEVKESAGENSGLSVVLRHENGRLEGGVDPRREGVITSF